MVLIIYKLDRLYSYSLLSTFLLRFLSRSACASEMVKRIDECHVELSNFVKRAFLFFRDVDFYRLYRRKNDTGGVSVLIILSVPKQTEGSCVDGARSHLIGSAGNDLRRLKKKKF